MLGTKFFVEDRSRDHINFGRGVAPAVCRLVSQSVTCLVFVVTGRESRCTSLLGFKKITKGPPCPSRKPGDF